MNKEVFITHSLDDMFTILEPWLVGLWRFREKGFAQTWCCTYTVGPHYYDTQPAKDKKTAMWRVYKQLKKDKVI